MKRNSTTVFIESTGATTPLPWLGTEPDFSDISEPTLSVLVAAWNEGKDTIEVLPDPEPFIVVLEPDWETLLAELLNGDLSFIYQRIRTASFAVLVEDIIFANNVSTALGMITDGIISIRIEKAVSDAISILLSIGYSFTEEERLAWNSKITELNFSELMFIQ